MADPGRRKGDVQHERLGNRYLLTGIKTLIE